VAEGGAEAMTRAHGVRYHAKDSAALCECPSTATDQRAADPAGGGSDDWAMGMAAVPYAYTIELRPNPTQSRLVHFDPPARILQPTGEEAVEGVKAMLATIKYVSVSRTSIVQVHRRRPMLPRHVSNAHEGSTRE